MIASPGDVVRERDIAREVINDWNAVHSRNRDVVVLPIAWETHSFPQMGDRPQEILNKQLLKDADALVAILWTRIGTETGTSPSGTVEEIHEHQKTGKPLLVYFSDVNSAPSDIDSAQLEAVRKFKAWCQDKGLYHTFASPDDFRQKFTTHLGLLMNSDVFMKNPAGAQGVVVTQPVPQREPPPVRIVLRESAASRRDIVELARSLGPDEARVLKAGASDPNGQILWFETVSGPSLAASNEDLLKGADARKRARYLQVMKDLVHKDLVDRSSSRGGATVYLVTKRGFEVADIVTLES